MARTTQRLVTAMAAAATTLTLAACGSEGVLTNGGTAATFGDYTVSTDEVSNAVTDINRFEQQAGITGQQAAVLLALEPEVSKLAARYGARMSASQVQEQYSTQMPRGVDLNDAAVRTLQSSAQLGALTNGKDPRGAQAAQKLITGADIELNPRYGEYNKGNMSAASTNWIAESSAEPAQ